MTRITPRMVALALTATAVLGFSGMAYAWHGGPGMGKGPGNGRGPCYAMQNISPEQQSAAQKLYDDFYASTDSVRQQLIVKEAELRAQMSGQAPDTKKIEDLSKELGTLRGQMLSARVGLDAKLNEAGLPAWCGRSDHGMGKYHDGRGWGGHGNGRGHGGHRGNW